MVATIGEIPYDAGSRRCQGRGGPRLEDPTRDMESNGFSGLR